MRAALGAAIAGILLLGPACSTPPPCGDCGFPYVMDLLISQQGGIVPVGIFQTIGVLIPGSDRTLSPSIPDRVMAQGAGHDPEGSSLVAVVPQGGAIWGQPEHLGGTVRLAASTGWFQSPWSVTIQIATDPLTGHDPHTYVGSGTTVMQLGQTFVMTWPVGSAPPTTSDSAVLRPWTAPIERVTNPVGRGSRPAMRYMEQVFVAAATGQALLSAPNAFDPKDGRTFGPSQLFFVKDDHRWTCSPAGGCSTPVATEDNWRPDYYHPPPPTPVPWVSPG